MSKSELMFAAMMSAKKYRIQPRFLAALIDLESRWEIGAMKYEKGYPWLYEVLELSKKMICSRETMEVIQKTSWGLMQLMGANFYQMGYRGWPIGMCDPKTNLEFGCKHLDKIIENQNLSFKKPLDIYAAYNAGSVRKTLEGLYVNARAVNAFEKKYNLLPEDFVLA